MNDRSVRMHDDQIDVPLDLVRRLVRDQFPAYATLPIQAFQSSGTVNAIFRIGGDRAARLVLQRNDPLELRAQLESEHSAMHEFAAHSTVPTPEPLAIGEPGQGYPLPWALHSWLPGQTALEADPARSMAFASDLAALVLALRAADTRGRRFAGGGRGGDLRDHNAWVATCLAKSEDLIDVPRLRRIWSELEDLPSAGPDVMSHADLIPGNLLVSEGRLAGVLDAGGFRPADPALDLVCAWHLLDAAPRASFRRQIDCSDLEWARGMAWALQQALGLGWYYLTSNPTMSAVGLRTLSRILDEV